MLASREAPVGRELRRKRVEGHDKVTVMPSMIPNAGNGLFALRTMEAGDGICGYTGTRSLSSGPNQEGLAMELPNDMGVLIGDPSSSFGPHANDPREDLLVNAKLKVKNMEAALIATQRIRPGEEVYLDYGLPFRADRLHLLSPSSAAETKARMVSGQRRHNHVHQGLQDLDILSISSEEQPGHLDDADDGAVPPVPKKPPPSSEAESIAWFTQHEIQDMLQWTKRFFSDLTSDESSVKDLLLRSFTLGSSVFGTASANEWAGGFSIPLEAVEADDKKWEACKGNFRDLVRNKRLDIDNERFSAERVSQFLSDDNPHKR